MLVTLIKKNHISTLSLPVKNHGQYWIRDINQDLEHFDLMSVGAKNGQWELRSNRKAKIVANEKTIKA